MCNLTIISGSLHVSLHILSHLTVSVDEFHDGNEVDTFQASCFLYYISRFHISLQMTFDSFLCVCFYLFLKEYWLKQLVV